MSPASSRRRGFTLVELMLAMSFIGLLLIVVTLTAIQMMRTYNRGLTLKEVNTVGRAVSDDIKRTIAASRPFIVYPPRVPGNPTVNYDSRLVLAYPTSVATDGRLCTGQYTYAWNIGRPNGSSYNKFIDSSQPLVRLVKVADAGGSLCKDMALNIIRTAATELLAAGDRELVVHRFEVRGGAQDLAIEQQLYTVTFMLGTPNDANQIDTSNNSCKPPKDLKGLEDYCAVNVFEIVARAGNRLGGQL